MKNKIAMAGLLSVAALLTPAHATTVLFTTTSSVLTKYNDTTNIYSVTGTNSGGTLTAYGYTGVLDNPAPAPTDIPETGSNPGTPTTYNSAPGVTTSSAGLGVNNGTTNQIAITDAVVLDFAGVSATVKANNPTITFKLTIDGAGPSDYTVYGLEGSNYVLLDYGSMAKTGNVSFTQATSGLYADYLVGVTNNDCDLTVDSVSIAYNGVVTTQAPEPGTFVMAGMALVAVGLTMKKRNRKA
jgi:hypothetical protein